jgi:hypothetical protein
MIFYGIGKKFIQKLIEGIEMKRTDHLKRNGSVPIIGVALN